MKKSLIFIVLVLIFSMAFAEVITVGSGEEQQANAPFNGGMNFGWSKSIYSRTEFNSNLLYSTGDIVGISYDLVDCPQGFQMRDQQIYLYQTVVNSYSSTNLQYMDLSEHTLVFDGTITFNSDGWQYIAFDTPFAMEANGGLEIVWVNNMGAKADSYPKFVSTQFGADKTVVNHSDTSLPTSRGALQRERPNLGLHMDYRLVPEIKIEPAISQYIFDELSIFRTATKCFEVSNIGRADLFIDQIYIDGNGAFELTNIPSFPAILAPESSFRFDLVFDPDRAGSHDANLTIVDNKGNWYIIELNGLGFDPTIREFPFFEGFEEGNDHSQPILKFWSQKTNSNRDWSANNYSQNSSIPSNSGNWSAYLAVPTETSLIRPILLLSGEEYLLKLYACKSTTAALDQALSFSILSDDSMSNVIDTTIFDTQIEQNLFRELNTTFSVSESGIYYIAIQGKHSISGNRIIIDDISIDIISSPYIAKPNRPYTPDEHTSLTLTGSGFLAASALDDGHSSFPNPNFIATHHQRWQLIGSGVADISIQSDEDWFAYKDHDVWRTFAGPNISELISIDLDAKDAIFEFATGGGSNPTLPVELSYFRAIYQAANKGVKLSWESQSESQMVGYRVYRNSADDLTSASLITAFPIEATNSSSGGFYTLMDHDVEPGVYYYWLEALSYTESSFYESKMVEISVFDNQPSLPLITQLHGAFPNPFNPNTTIMYELSHPSRVKIEVFNLRGQLIDTLLDANKPEGKHYQAFHAYDSQGNRLSSGLYFYRLTAGKHTQMKKMLLMQ